jgi:anti-sigma28 factor (negative regulator of flagellin synthesis)
MEVNGPSSIGGAVPVGKKGVDPAPPKVSEARPATPRDEVDISEASRVLDELNRNSELRAERLAKIKAAIEDGTYETPEKLEAALRKMIASHDLEVDASS